MEREEETTCGRSSRIPAAQTRPDRQRKKKTYDDCRFSHTNTKEKHKISNSVGNRREGGGGGIRDVTGMLLLREGQDESKEKTKSNNTIESMMTLF